MSQPAKAMPNPPRHPRAIAFYLPQYHPIPENDAWWGPGFTEWHNVSRGRPSFDEHQQPQLPADLGFYDLRVPEVRAAQAELARSYGIHGFCYYYYSFGGKRLLERPLREVVASGEPDFPFCVCWANENWTRSWDGAEHEILIEQKHSPESDAALIEELIPLFRDERYIRYEGKPVLLVYRADLLPHPVRTTEIWREVCRQHGIPEIHLAAVLAFGLLDPRSFGFDAAVEFPPHGVVAPDISSEQTGLSPDFDGHVYDYRSAVDFGLRAGGAPYRLHRGVMTAWDSTARRGTSAHVWHGSTPAEYERWLGGVVRASLECSDDPEPLVFINAWNEWAEGAHLEPDQHNGHGYLEATRRALELAVPSDTCSADLRPASEEVAALEASVARYRAANQTLRTQLASVRWDLAATGLAFQPEAPSFVPRDALEICGEMVVDRAAPLDEFRGVVVSHGWQLRLEGWAFADGIDPGADDTHSCIVLYDAVDDRSYYTALAARFERPDVQTTLRERNAQESEVPLHTGFHLAAWIDGIDAGEYEVGCIHVVGERAVATFSGFSIRVPARFAAREDFT